MKNVDHDAVSMLSSFEAHSTFTDEMSGQWFNEMSLMPDADADLLEFCSWHLNVQRLELSLIQKKVTKHGKAAHCRNDCPFLLKSRVIQSLGWCFSLRSKRR